MTSLEPPSPSDPPRDGGVAGPLGGTPPSSPTNRLGRWKTMLGGMMNKTRTPGEGGGVPPESGGVPPESGGVPPESGSVPSGASPQPRGLLGRLRRNPTPDPGVEVGPASAPPDVTSDPGAEGVGGRKFMGVRELMGKLRNRNRKGGVPPDPDGSTLPPGSPESGVPPGEGGGVPPGEGGGAGVPPGEGGGAGGTPADRWGLGGRLRRRRPEATEGPVLDGVGSAPAQDDGSTPPPGSGGGVSSKLFKFWKRNSSGNDGADGPATPPPPNRAGKFLGRLLRPGTNSAAPDVVESSPPNGGGASTVVVLVSLLCVWILAWMAALQVLGISEFVVKPAAAAPGTTGGCPGVGGGGASPTTSATNNIWTPGWLRPYWDAALMATLFGLVWVAIVVALIVLLEKLVGQQLLMESPWSTIMVIPVAVLACIPTIVIQASGAVDMDKHVSPNLFYATPLICVLLTLLLKVVYM